MSKSLDLIALDMDGVVNSDTHIKQWIANKKTELIEAGVPEQSVSMAQLRKALSIEFRNMCECVFPDLAAKINRICLDTDAYILWSSTWRTLPMYQNIALARDMFDRRGLPGYRLVGYTRDLGADACRGVHISRGAEIADWIKHSIYRIGKCAVLDDRSDAGRDLPANCRFFKTQDTYGITDDIVTNVIQYLKTRED